MRKHLQVTAAATVLACALASPAAVQAAVSGLPVPVRYQMETSLRDLQQPGQYEGNLSLVVYPNGIVNGYYTPQDGSPRDVTGGIDGQTIWLDIQGTDAMHLSGTLKDGDLRTTVSVPGPDTVVFESTKSVRTST